MYSLIPFIFSFLFAHTVAAASDSAIVQGILDDVNTYRRQHHLAPLQLDATISAQAKIHSIEMANHKEPFGHTHFLDRVTAIRKQIKNSGAAAENVAFNYKDAHDVVKNWLLSPGHKRNIVGHYNLTGIGIARDHNGKLYFTQLFIKTDAPSSVTRRTGFTKFYESISKN